MTVFKSLGELFLWCMYCKTCLPRKIIMVKITNTYNISPVVCLHWNNYFVFIFSEMSRTKIRFFFLANLKEDISGFTSAWKKSFFSSVFSPIKLNIYLVLWRLFRLLKWVITFLWKLTWSPTTATSSAMSCKTPQDHHQQTWASWF